MVSLFFRCVDSNEAALVVYHSLIAARPQQLADLDGAVRHGRLHLLTGDLDGGDFVGVAHEWFPFR